MALQSLELFCFGAPTATVGRKAPPREVLWRKHLGLLVYLALSPDRRRTREHLMGVFWPESTQDKARRSLNAAVFHLRKRLGDDRLKCDQLSVTLEERGLEVDALRFAIDAERAPQAALRLLRGQFLEGFYVDDASELEDWIANERLRFSRLTAAALVRAAGEELKERRLTLAIEHARRALEFEPHSKPAITLVMRTLFQTGDTTGALAAFHEFSGRLKNELREEPTRDLVELAGRLRKHREIPVPDQLITREVPLVGRAPIHAAVFGELERGLSGGARTVVIKGAGGMGRTRLLAECRDQGRADGAWFAAARPLECDHDSRWSTLRQLFRGGLADAPGLLGAPARALSTLAPVIPELGARFPPQPSQDVAEMADALAAVVRAIADEQALELAVDDAHWADGASIAALHGAQRQLANARVVLVVSVATDTPAVPLEVQRLDGAVTRSLPGASVALEPLTTDDLRTLVTQLASWCHTDEERTRLARRLAHESGGNPLYAVTLLGALARQGGYDREPRYLDTVTFGSPAAIPDIAGAPGGELSWPRKDYTTDDPLPVSVPTEVKRAIEMRLTELTKSELAVLCTASLGPDIDLDLIAQASGLSRDDVDVALPGLERRNLVAFDGTRYRFVAPIVSHVVRSECLLPGERRKLERRVLELLSARTDLEGRVWRCELLSRVAPDRHAFDTVLAVIKDAGGSGGTRLVRRARVAGERIAAEARLDPAELLALVAGH